MPDALADPPPMLDCRYFRAGRCRSCTLIETPYARQVQEKDAACRDRLPQVPASAWLPPFTAGDRGFRNRVKLVVGGRAGRITLGILDPDGAGVDLRECQIQSPGIASVLPPLAALLDRTGLAPYDVPARRGEIKFVHLTEAPTEPGSADESGGGALMLRFVVRTERGLGRLRDELAEIRRVVPRARVISVNLLPEHKAVLEGDQEYVLWGETLPIRLGGVTLHLRPQSFFQTNTRVAEALYAQVAAWVDDLAPASLWDLYCGVGGFALTCAAPGRRVTGVELSEHAVDSARRSAREAGVSATFLAADAWDFAREAAAEQLPETLIVNPPRRGLGAELSEWIEASPIRSVVYSSCNPESLARDLAAMPGFAVSAARVFDMFPHTRHVECAVLLTRTAPGTRSAVS